MRLTIWLVLVLLAFIALGCATPGGPLLDLDSEWPDDEPYCTDLKYSTHPDCK